MADIFSKNDAQRVVENRIIWLFGDSNIRAMYKDLVWLLQKNTLIDLSSLRNKLEDCYMNDTLMKGKEINKGRNYTEVRCFEDFAIPTKIEFTFVTECLSKEIHDKLTNLNSSDMPDILVMNSCLWDITRWGPDGVDRYKRNVRELLKLFQTYLPSKTLVIWTTTPPLSTEPVGGFLIKQINFMKPFLRFEVMEANMFLGEEVVRHGFDLLDIHYHLMLQIHRRRPDGIHWNPDAVRHMTNLLLTHIALSLYISLPGNFSSPFLDKVINMDKNERDGNNNTVKGDNVERKLIIPPLIPATKGPQASINEANAKKDKSKKKKKRERYRGQKSGRVFSDQYSTPFLYGHYPNNNNFCGKMKNYNFNQQRRNNNYRPY